MAFSPAVRMKKWIVPLMEIAIAGAMASAPFRTVHAAMDDELFAQQFPGADIGAKINTAEATLSTGGGTIFIGCGNFHFSTTIAISKDVILRGCAQGFQNRQIPMYGTKLTWTGVGGTAIRVTGDRVQATLRDFSLDNVGSGEIGIDIDEFASGVVVERVSMFPQGTGFSIAGIRLGATANVVDITLRDVYVRNNAVGLAAHSVIAFLNLDHARFIYNKINNVQVGDAENDVFAFNATNSTFEGLLDTTSVNITRVLGASFVNCYFENAGTGYAIDIPNTAVVAWSVSVDHSTFSGFTSSAPYAIDADFASADLRVTNSMFIGFSNPSFLVNNQNAARIHLAGNTLLDAGASLATSNNHLVAFSNFLASAGSLAPDQVPSTAASNATTKAAALRINSPLPVANLNAMPATYSAAGVQRMNVHIVQDTAIFVAGTVTVTLSGSAAFSSPTSYVCSVTRSDSSHATTVVNNSGTSFTISSAGKYDSDAVHFLCAGS